MSTFNKYGATFDGTTAPLYALQHGENKPIGIAKMSYRIVREAAPIYSMGTPSPRSFERVRRGIEGTFVISMESFLYFGEQGFDIHALVEEQGTDAELRLEDVAVIEMREDFIARTMECSFICKSITINDIHKPVQETTNREMALKVLELS